MRKFYEVFSDEKLNPLGSKLSWSHYRELITIKNLDEIIYYIDVCEKNNLSKRELQERIKNNEYERLPEETKNRIISKTESSVIDYVKNPIIIKNKYNTNDISEKVLQQLILEDIESFMNELGNSFCFISSEYKIKLGDRYNYIDLLLFNIEYNCYVVII